MGTWWRRNRWALLALPFRANIPIGAAMNTEDPAEITMPAIITQAKPDSVSPPNSASVRLPVATVDPKGP